jgi:hypothetical protein
MSAVRESLIGRIDGYLTVGGLFNPEMADHQAVSNLLRDCREYLRSLRTESDVSALLDKARREQAEAIKKLIAKWRSGKHAERLRERWNSGDSDAEFSGYALDELLNCADNLDDLLNELAAAGAAGKVGDDGKQ